MKQKNRFASDMLDMDGHDARGDAVYRASVPQHVRVVDGNVVCDVPFAALRADCSVGPDPAMPRETFPLTIQAYGDDIIRLRCMFGPEQPEIERALLQMEPGMTPEALCVERRANGWAIMDSGKRCRMTIADHADIREQAQNDSERFVVDAFDATVFPDGATPVPFAAFDYSTFEYYDSLPLGFVRHADHPHRVCFSFKASHDEAFAGTGERFAAMNLAGTTVLLENEDAHGVNSRRCYKNVPFYLSSHLYGVLVLTSAHARLSFADISTQAVQGMVEFPGIDLFLIGGDSPARIVRNYQRMTGMPAKVPLWSLGAWMSRAAPSYKSEQECLDVARTLRKDRFPCDVLHLDAGWFEKYAHCDWQFGKSNFPDPSAFIEKMRALGFRISAWQLPYLRNHTDSYKELKERGLLDAKPEGSRIQPGSRAMRDTGILDFTNPATGAWYQDAIGALTKLGVAAIKTDFGEEIDMESRYAGMSAALLHNLYPLLYEKTAYEAMAAHTDEPLIWARPAWTGCQRYPIHWGGDPSSTWEGLAGTIRGGLHLGISGFAFWSHDIGGFAGIPFPFRSRPSHDLLIRWLQVGVFSSHLRFHGMQPREPYEYPEIAALIRQWLRLRYCLIPYLSDQAEEAIHSGMPVFRAMLFHHWDDPHCWHIDDQFFCGDSLLVAPILNEHGLRDVYLPQGEWVDVWTGSRVCGPRLLKNVRMPLEKIPVYAASGHSIRVYPKPVQSTNEIIECEIATLHFDSAFTGIFDALPLALDKSRQPGGAAAVQRRSV